MIHLKIKFIKSKFNSSKYDIAVVSFSKGIKSRNFFIEKIGYFRPILNKYGQKELFLNYNRLAIWLNRGAKIGKTILKYIKFK